MKTSASLNHLENMFELMVGPILRDKAFISTNPVCLCSVKLPLPINGMPCRF